MPRLCKFLSSVLNPQYWPALVRGVVPGIEHTSAFIDQNYRAIIDVGANKGQFAAFALTRWPRARLICFEPLPRARAKLASITANRAEVHPYALGEVEGGALMHVASRADSSSLLPLGERQKRIFDMGEASRLNVQVRRLDSVIEAGSLPRPALLKIDVQGFEYETLKGAESLLKVIDGVYVEVSFVELYAGQKLAVDVAALLQRYGFRQAGRFNAYVIDGATVQADILFKKGSR